MENIIEERKIKVFEISNKDTVLVIILTFFSVLMSFLGICGGFRGGFAVTNILTIAIMTAFSFKNGYKFKFKSAIFFAEVVLLSSVFFVTSNVAVRFIGFIILILVSFLLFFSFSKEETDKNEYDFFASILSLLFGSVIVNLPVTAKSLFANNEDGKKTISKILIGLVASLPVLLIIVPLLMSSDEAFSGLIKIFGNNVFLSLLKIALGIIIAFFLVTFCLTLKNNEMPKCAEFNLKRIDRTVIISFMSSISVCYIAYLISQLAYFFSAFKGLLPEDYSFTMATYARRGFFEMCIIAVINFLLVFCVVLFSKENNAIIKILSIFICVFTLVIIATAISKMFLYIDNFGMTQLRVLTTAFMIFLTVMFIVLIFKIFISRILILKLGVAVSAVVLIVLGLFNVNAFIAKYNYTAYTENKLSTIDVATIYELGEEGVPYLIKLTEDSDVSVRNSANDYLLNCYIYDFYDVEENLSDGLIVYKIVGKKYNSIGSFGVSRNRAYMLLDDFLEKYPYFLYDYYDLEFPESYYAY